MGGGELENEGRWRADPSPRAQPSSLPAEGSFLGRALWVEQGRTAVFLGGGSRRLTDRSGPSGGSLSPAPTLRGTGTWMPSSARRGREPAQLWESAPPTPAWGSCSAKSRLREDVGGAASVLAAVAGQDPPPHLPLVLPLFWAEWGALPAPRGLVPSNPVEAMTSGFRGPLGPGEIKAGDGDGGAAGLRGSCAVISPAAACWATPPSLPPRASPLPSAQLLLEEQVGTRVFREGGSAWRG